MNKYKTELFDVTFNEAKVLEGWSTLRSRIVSTMTT